MNNPGKMTKDQEYLWKKAKKIVQKEYAHGKPYSEFTERNWAQVGGIYRNMQEFGAKPHRRKNPNGDTTTEINLKEFQKILFEEARSEVEKKRKMPFNRFDDVDWADVVYLYKQKRDYRRNPTITEEDLNAAAEHELEHTDNIEEARKIAMDHLREDPCYYEKLKLVQRNPRSKRWPEE